MLLFCNSLIYAKVQGYEALSCEPIAFLVELSFIRLFIDGNNGLLPVYYIASDLSPYKYRVVLIVIVALPGYTTPYIFYDTSE